MGTIEISLSLPIELGAEVLSEPVVREALDGVPEARVVSSADAHEAGVAYEDFGAVAIAILGSAGAVAGVKALFGVVKTAIEQAYQTRRERQAQEHELRKLILVMGQERNEIDLAQRRDELEGRLAELERQAVELVS